MGMASSQVRLLGLISRIHDVEYEAQSIQAKKLALATQSDAVYQEYCDALDATTLTVKDKQGGTNVANFNNLFGMDAINPAVSKKYALTNESGLLVVDDDIYEAYQNFMKSGRRVSGEVGSADTLGNNAGADYAYAFAMWMCGMDSSLEAEDYSYENSNALKGFFPSEEDAKGWLDNIFDNPDQYPNITGNSAMQTKWENIKEKDELLEDYNNDNKFNTSKTEAENYAKLRNQACQQLLKMIFGNQSTLNEVAQMIYGEQGNNNIDNSEFEYYLNMFKKIEAAGGCVSLSQVADTPDAANDSDWLLQQIQSGDLLMSVVSYDAKTGEATFTATSTATDTNISETPTTTVDSSALKRAEAKYNYETKQIDKKDKQYDMQLTKLETERSALTTEIDSVKKVIQDNVERTFGIFS